jgi:TonB family protein
MHRTSHSRWLISLLLIASCPACGDWQPTEIVGVSYPRLAQLARIAGVVVVRTTVGPDGSVTEAVAVSGHPLLSEAALRSAKEWKFGQSNLDRGSARDVYLVYRFVLKGTCAGNECRETFLVYYPNFVVVRSEMPSLQVSGWR